MEVYCLHFTITLGRLRGLLLFIVPSKEFSRHNNRLLDDNIIEYHHFLYVLKFKIDMEHKICKKNNTAQTFNMYSYI